MANLFSNFLSGLSGTGGSNLFNLLSGWATGGFKGRPQWRDLQFMNDAQNRLWPDEIKRQGDFLEGLAPSQGKAMETLAPYQAGAYNTYQNATFGQDTARQTERIKSMASNLGMSPWEITGAGGATPLPSPSGPMPQGAQGRSPMPDFLQGLMPLKIAEMQNKTSLMTAKMSNDTQRYIADQQTGKGGVAQAQIEQAAATVENLRQSTKTGHASENLIWTQAQAAENETALSTIRTFAQYAGQTSMEFMGYKSTSTNNFPALLKLYKQMTNTATLQGNQDHLADLIRAMPSNEWKQINKDIDQVVEIIAKRGSDMISGAGKAISDFMTSMTGPKQ